MCISARFGIESCTGRSWYNSKNLFKYCRFFVCDFLRQTVSLPPDQNFLIPSDKYVSILLKSNIYNWNIGTFWRRKLCNKTWYSSRYLWILLIFLLWYFWGGNILIRPTHILLWPFYKIEKKYPPLQFI